MQTVTTKAMAKVAAVATGLAMATSMLTLAPMVHAASLSAAQVQSILSLLSSFGANSSTIASVNAALTGTAAPATTPAPAAAGSYTFSKDLTVGATGADVTALQNILISKGYLSGSATGYFGAMTKAAVIKWQTAAGLSPAAGYVGAKSRAALNGVAATTPGTTPAPVTAGTGTGLKVMLSATSPNGTVLVAGQAIGDLGDFVFANPTAAPINVTGLTFNRTGVSNDATISNVYLYNGVNRLTDSAGVSSQAFSYSNGAGIFTVPAGQTYTVSVRSDISTGTSGQQLGVSLVSVSSSGTLDSSVSLPIMSGYQTISAATLATVDFSANASTLPASATTISPQSAYPVWQNTITVSSNPVKLTSMRFTNLGSIDSTYVSNVRLYVDGVQVGAALPTLAADRTATFDLSAAPKSLTTASHVIKVVADLTGGSNRTAQFSIQRSSDAYFVDSQLNQPVTPTKASSAFSAVTSGGAITMNYVSGSTGVSVTADPSSPTASVPVGGSSIKLASFDFLASGENVKVQDLYVSAVNSGQTQGGLANGKIFVNGVQVGSTKTLGYSSSGTTNSTDFSLGSSLILPAGKTVVVDIYADTKTSTSTNLASGETTTIYINGSAALANGQGQSSLNSVNVPNSDVHGNAITVNSSSLTSAKYSGYGNQTVISGTNNALLGAFTLSAGSTEGVLVNTIGVNVSAANAASITNLTLKDGTGANANIIGSVVTTPSSGTNSYSVNLDIPANASKTIYVYANILSGVNPGVIAVGLDYTTGGTGDITGLAAAIGTSGAQTAASGNTPAYTTLLQSITVGTGYLSAALGAGNPTSQIVIAGASQLKAGQFTFTAQYSPFTVDSLAILVPANAATSVSSLTLAYTDKNGQAQTTPATSLHLPTGSQTYATAVFTGLTMYVPANSTGNVDVYVNTPTVASGASSGASISVSLSNIANAFGGSGFHASNSAGSATTSLSSQINSTDTSGQGVLMVRQSVPTFSSVAVNSTNSLVQGAGSAIAEVKVSSDAAGATSWSKLAFTVTKSTDVVIGATSTLAMYSSASGSSWTLLNGSFATTTATSSTSVTQTVTDPWGVNSSGGTLVFLPAAEQQVAAGQSMYYQVRGTVGVTATGNGHSLSFSLANPSTSATTSSSVNIGGQGLTNTPSVVWSDRSSISVSHSLASSDWTDDYLVPGLTVNFPTLSTTF